MPGPRARAASRRRRTQHRRALAQGGARRCAAGVPGPRAEFNVAPTATPAQRGRAALRRRRPLPKGSSS
eukprot:14536997-Alexandrium_andersonii.AAC.1